jgi:hypothetical protein
MWNWMHWMSQVIVAASPAAVFDHPIPNFFVHVDGSVVMSATDQKETAPEETLVSNLGV